MGKYSSLHDSHGLITLPVSGTGTETGAGAWTNGVYGFM